MPGGLFRIIATAAVTIGLCHAAFAGGGQRPQHRLAANSAAPVRHPRPSSSRQSELDTPGQTTVLTRETLDDMNATTLRGALRSTAGVTVGR